MFIFKHHFVCPFTFCIFFLLFQCFLAYFSDLLVIISYLASLSLFISKHTKFVRIIKMVLIMKHDNVTEKHSF